MTNSRRPLARSGVRACTIAAAINLSTAGRLSTLADSRRMKRVWRPDPSSRPSGSASVAPRMKHRPTPLAPAVNDTMESDGRSVGE